MLCAYRRFGARSMNEIAAEIASVVIKINGINETLNVREMVAEVFTMDNEGIEERAERVSGLFKYAAEMLDELRELYRSLELLKNELSSVWNGELFENGGDAYD